jgi:uncharacterized membrane protein HdeD (DUF308 family)
MVVVRPADEVTHQDGAFADATRPVETVTMTSQDGEVGNMVGMLTRNWGWIALRGAVAILFGLLTLFRPGITLATLILFFGAYALVDGIFMAVSAIANRHGEPRWGTLLVGGLLGIAAGIVTFMWPQLTAAILLSVIAVWAIVMGIFEVAAAIRLRKQLDGEWALILAGVLAVAFGVFLIMRPGVGALAVVLWIGAYALISGIVLLSLSFRLRNWGRLHPAV